MSKDLRVRFENAHIYESARQACVERSWCPVRKNPYIYTTSLARDRCVEGSSIVSGSKTFIRVKLARRVSKDLGVRFENVHTI